MIEGDRLEFYTPLQSVSVAAAAAVAAMLAGACKIRSMTQTRLSSSARLDDRMIAEVEPAVGSNQSVMTLVLHPNKLLSVGMGKGFPVFAFAVIDVDRFSQPLSPTVVRLELTTFAWRGLAWLW